jgi:hypothetical protein
LFRCSFGWEAVDAWVRAHECAVPSRSLRTSLIAPARVALLSDLEQYLPYWRFATVTVVVMLLLLIQGAPGKKRIENTFA